MNSFEEQVEVRVVMIVFHLPYAVALFFYQQRVETSYGTRGGARAWNEAMFPECGSSSIGLCSVMKLSLIVMIIAKQIWKQPEHIVANHFSHEASI